MTKNIFLSISKIILDVIVCLLKTDRQKFYTSEFKEKIKLVFLNSQIKTRITIDEQKSKLLTYLFLLLSRATCEGGGGGAHRGKGCITPKMWDPFYNGRSPTSALKIEDMPSIPTTTNVICLWPKRKIFSRDNIHIKPLMTDHRTFGTTDLKSMDTACIRRVFRGTRNWTRNLWSEALYHNHYSSHSLFPYLQGK